MTLTAWQGMRLSDTAVMISEVEEWGLRKPDDITPSARQWWSRRKKKKRKKISTFTSIYTPVFFSYRYYCRVFTNLFSSIWQKAFEQAFRSATVQTFEQQSLDLLMLRGRKDFLRNCKSSLLSQNQMTVKSRMKNQVIWRQVCEFLNIAGVYCVARANIFCTDEQDKSTETKKPESSEGRLALSFFLLNISSHTEKSADPKKAWTLIREPVHPPRVAQINQGAFKNALESIPLFSTRAYRKGRGAQRSWNNLLCVKKQAYWSWVDQNWCWALIRFGLVFNSFTSKAFYLTVDISQSLHMAIVWRDLDSAPLIPPRIASVRCA